MADIIANKVKLCIGMSFERAVFGWRKERDFTGAAVLNLQMERGGKRVDISDESGLKSGNERLVGVGGHVNCELRCFVVVLVATRRVEEFWSCFYSTIEFEKLLKSEVEDGGVCIGIASVADL